MTERTYHVLYVDLQAWWNRFRNACETSGLTIVPSFAGTTTEAMTALTSPGSPAFDLIALLAMGRESEVSGLSSASTLYLISEILPAAEGRIVAIGDQVGLGAAARRFQDLRIPIMDRYELGNRLPELVRR